MRWNTQPALVTLEGEQLDAYEAAELLGIDEEDAELLGRCGGRFLSGDDIAYLNEKYPEYMGIWPLIAKAGALIAKGGAAAFKGIRGAVQKAKARKAAKKESSAVADMQRKMVAQQQAMMMQQQQQQAAASAAQKKKLLMIGLPLAAVALFLLMGTNKPAPAAAAPAPEKGGKK